MPYPDDPGEVLVSLQDRSRGVDAAHGHLVLGVLVDPGRAVFQVPPDFAIGGEAQLEVLIAPTGATGGETVIERIKLQRVWVSSLTPVDRPQAAAVLLAQPSQYAGEPTPVDPDTLAAVLSRHTDIWDALLELGVVRRTLTDVNASDALRRIARIEEIQRRVLLSTVLGKDGTTISNCIFSTACHPWKKPA
jgi:hypothetical protein